MDDVGAVTQMAIKAMRGMLHRTQNTHARAFAHMMFNVEDALGKTWQQGVVNLCAPTDEGPTQTATQRWLQFVVVAGQ